MRLPLRHEVRLLRGYALACTLVLCALGVAAFGGHGTQRFKEITVERINVVEPDGRTRLVIANAAQSPAVTSKGRTFGAPGGRPGLIFYNDEGGENGGLVFNGKASGGEVVAFGGLMFDQYNQDQVIALSYTERGGRRSQGLTVLDRPDAALADILTERERIRQMPEGTARDSAQSAWVTAQGGAAFGAPRLFAGRDEAKASVVELSDRLGRPRVRIAVDSLGAAAIEFLNDSGAVVHRITPDGR